MIAVVGVLGVLLGAAATHAFPPKGWQVVSGGDSGTTNCRIDAVKKGLDPTGKVSWDAPKPFDPAEPWLLSRKSPSKDPAQVARESAAVRAPRVRKSVTALSDAERFNLKWAFNVLQNLPDTDPRAMSRFASLNCLYSGGMYTTGGGVALGAIDRNWFFFPFHRAYLFFLERSLRWVLVQHLDKLDQSVPENKKAYDDHILQALSFTLPYWDWTTPASTNSGDATVKVPDVYWTNGLSTALPAPSDSPLSHDIGSQADLRLDVEFWQNTAVSVDTFFGTSTKPGKSFSSVHATPLNNAGGWMWHILHASRQPIFFAHHGNLDRMWHEWTRRHSTTPMPASAAFKTTRFRFPDADGLWTEISAETVSNPLPGTLGYTYQ